MLAPVLNSVLSQPSGQLSSFYQQTQTTRQSAVLESSATRVENAYDGFKVFEQLLQKGYESLRTGGRYQPVPAAGSGEPGAAAERILGFIERRLQRDIAEGADSEALASRLEAGLEGFKRGFADAREQLQDLGLLRGPVAQKRDATYDRVLAGVDALGEQYADAGTQSPAAAPLSVTPAVAGVGVASGFNQYSYAQRNSFSFELETADGDTVRIQADAREFRAASTRFAAVGDGEQVVTAQSFATAYGNSQQFSLSIEGELDADELAAINDLLGRVNDLSRQFFGGDLEGAFNSAVNLGYDSSEIVGFALNLSRVEVERVTTAYQQFEAPGVYAGPALSSSLAPLGDFARDLLGAVELASPFEQPRQLVRDLAEQVGLLDDGRQPGEEKRFGPFVERMLDSLGAV